MSDSIFDLEQKIMDCWKVVDDVNELYQYLGDDPYFAGMKPEAEDKQANLLLGIHSMYELKFQNLWKLFEVVCKEYHERGKEVELLKERNEFLDQARIEWMASYYDSISRSEPNEDLKVCDMIEAEKQEMADKARRRSSIDEAYNKVLQDTDESRMDIIGQNGNDGLHYPSDRGNQE